LSFEKHDFTLDKEREKEKHSKSSLSNYPKEFKYDIENKNNKTNESYQKGLRETFVSSLKSNNNLNNSDKDLARNRSRELSEHIPIETLLNSSVPINKMYQKDKDKDFEYDTRNYLPKDHKADEEYFNFMKK